ncbi:glucosaminidase domain-containing protein [Deinococcus taeanensis]|uniref:glucosaminidase domain-containing protein n=1 Tax=Deinococcus taeanensis TaxID=2737050 RepID=UPI001CDCD1CF|nr:glucosaminidase domain-containing protein [Deinococcus taeanensis]UBV43058.1 glucosaminidase domain-containing protein [Deinococcus taeanensis]
MFDTKEPITGIAPQLKAPTSVSTPRSLKSTQQTWERTFRGKAKGVTFQLRIIRKPNGELSARYQAIPGRGRGWHLEGQLFKDNTFVLRGTENNAEFQGRISPDGTILKSRFINNTHKGKFEVGNLRLSVIPVSTGEIIAKSSTSTIRNGDKEESGHLNRIDIPLNLANEINNVNYTPKSSEKKERHEVYFHIVNALQKLGVPYPELIAAQWATESSWGRLHSGKNNIFGIKEFDPDKPRTFVMTKEWDPKQSKTVDKSEPFADYNDSLDAFIARANFTFDNPRYRKAGYFESKTLKEAAYAIDRAGYANTGQPGKYAESLIDIMKGCGVDVEKQTSLINKETEKNDSDDQSNKNRTSNEGSPDQLDRLIGLTTYKKTYSIREINLARSMIGKMTSKRTQGDLFELLQTKVPYRNQRNNNSVGLQSDRWTYKGRDGKLHWVIYTGKPIGDIMCNLTSLTMVLETLGIQNPSDEQYEDFLERVRRENNLPPRTTQSGWAGIARQLKARETKHFYNYRGGYDKWSQDLLPRLREGQGIMMSLNGHIIRLQSVNQSGITVDDPYGRLPSLLAYNPNHVTASYSGNLNSTKKEEGVGEDVVFPWTQVSKFTFLWIAAFERN